MVTLDRFLFLMILVVINHLNFERVPSFPPEADSPLLVDSDAITALAITFQLFQPVAAGCGQIIQRHRTVNRHQFAKRRPLDVWRKSVRHLFIPKFLGVPASKRPDHRTDTNAQREQRNIEAGSHMVNLEDWPATKLIPESGGDAGERIGEPLPFELKVRA